MYKVVVIDDEPVIVEGLTKVVDWEKYQCTLVGTAEDGESGLEIIREKRPDIIITDISMPGMDGLTMIAALKSEFAQMEICILTGYRDFDYAQKAINLGVTRFLLKPSDMKEIDEAMVIMTQRLEQRKSFRGHSDAQEEKALGTEGASSFIVKNAMDYMEENYAQHLTLPEVAERIYVSQWHLSKLLNRYKKKTFYDILNQIRVKHAKELLREPSLRIGDVAEKVGFMDMAHFSRVFKKYEGISANEYRNRKFGAPIEKSK